MDQENLARLARHLDGQVGPLPPELRRLAEELRQDEAWLAGRLGVDPPAGLLHRVRARIERAPVPGTAARRWFRPVLGAAAAVAAAVLVLAVLLGGPDPRPSTPPQPRVALTDEEAVQYYVQELHTPLDDELAILQEELGLTGGTSLNWELLLLGYEDLPGSL